MTRWSIRARLFAAVFAFAAGFTLAFQYFWVPRVTQIFVETQQREIARQIDVIIDSLTPFLLGNQFAAVDETLSAIETRYDNWNDVVLTRRDGVKVYPMFRPAPAEAGAGMILKRVVTLRGKEWGTLRARIDLTEGTNQVYRELRTLGGITLGATLLMFFVLGYALDRFVTRRLSLLARAAEQMGQGNFEADLPSGGGDEVGRLVNSFDDMRNKILKDTDELKSARTTAVNALAAKTRFLATMSHEIRTPLNGIIPVAEILQQSNLTPEQSRKVTTIQNSGRALRGIVDDILDLTKAEAGKIDIRSGRFNLARLADEVVDMLSVTASGKGIAIVADCHDALDRTLIGDEGRIRQILLNLAGNGMKFTEEGSVTVKCYPLFEQKDRVKLSIDVIDTGIGIPLEDQERIFKRFEQAEGGFKQRFEGTGLGLAISKTLTEAMGGEITLKSHYGEGSTFRVTLTLEVPSEDDLPAQAGAGADHAHPAGARRILVVDDNPVNTEVVQIMLEQIGHTVETAANGREAVTLVSERAYDLVLMDVQMPVLDGIQATHEIRAFKADRKDTRIVALTAGVLDRDRTICLEAGMNDVLVKPLSLDSLRTAVQRWAFS